MKYVAPEFELADFVCPYSDCGVHAHMRWAGLHRSVQLQDAKYQPLYSATCARCLRDSVWLARITSQHINQLRAGTKNAPTKPSGLLLYPQALSAPAAHEQLPDDCKGDYEEARSIAQASPRGAAALLRLVVQKICAHLGEPGKNINTDIGKLVEKKVISERLQKALDSVRVIGNNAIHPLEMNIEDKPELVGTLFALVNMMVEYTIAQPKAEQAIFDSIPDGAKEAIGKRDNKPT